MDSKQLYDEFRQTWELMKGALDSKADQYQIERLNTRMDQLETALSRPPRADPAPVPAYDVTKPPHKEAKTFFKMVKAGGPENLHDPDERRAAHALRARVDTLYTPEERKALAIGDDTLGGFLAPPEFAQEIIKGIQLVSPLRSIARIRPTAARSVQVPVRSGVFTAVWVNEGASRSETTGLKYSMEEISAFAMHAEVVVSNEDLEDSAFDLYAQIAAEAAEQFAKLEGSAFVNGTGVKQPEGFMVNSSIAYDAGGDTSLVTGDGVIDHLHALKSGYANAPGCRFVLNRKTLGALRKLKAATTGDYIWQPNYALGTPPTILGVPYVEMPDMDDVGANKYPVAIGDFSRGYLIVDRIDISVQRLVEKYAESGQVAFLIRKRVGGQVVLPEAIRKLKIATS